MPGLLTVRSSGFPRPSRQGNRVIFLVASFEPPSELKHRPGLGPPRGPHTLAPLPLGPPGNTNLCPGVSGHTRLEPRHAPLHPVASSCPQVTRPAWGRVETMRWSLAFFFLMTKRVLRPWASGEVGGSGRLPGTRPLLWPHRAGTGGEAGGTRPHLCLQRPPQQRHGAQMEAEKGVLHSQLQDQGSF